MELGAAITVILASQYGPSLFLFHLPTLFQYTHSLYFPLRGLVRFDLPGIPVSTTMCITGGTIGVGLCNGDLRAVNWRQIGEFCFQSDWRSRSGQEVLGVGDWLCDNA
jgi:hypothetical protein